MSIWSLDLIFGISTKNGCERMKFIRTFTMDVAIEEGQTCNIAPVGKWFKVLNSSLPISQRSRICTLSSLDREDSEAPAQI